MNESKEDVVIDSAHSVFLRYGFKRVTMQDIAEVAGISRPAIYLLFPNKEAIFKAVIKKMNEQRLETIRQGIAWHKTIRDKLHYAFDVWAIQPFDLIKSSPDAKELLYSAYQLAADVLNKNGRDFEVLLFSILDPAMKNIKTFHSQQLAHLLRGSVRGFKEIAHDVEELRQLIKDLIELVMQSIGK